MYETKITSNKQFYLGKKKASEVGVTPRKGAPVKAVVWKDNEFMDFDAELGSSLKFTIPAEVRNELGIEEGDDVLMAVEPDTSDAGLDALYN